MPATNAAGRRNRARVFMDTLVTIEVSDPDSAAVAARIDAAFAWFARVESVCSRFDPASDLRRLCATPGVPVAVEPLLFRAIEFALAVARASVGAFDPTVGGTLTRQGFDTNFRTGERVVLSEPTGADLDDIMLDSDAGTVTLQRPLLLDLGGVAKGMAIDLAAQELRPCRDFAINAGGDVYLAGQNPGGHPWRVGIRHPRIDDAIIAEVAVSGMAVCTSGDYERRRPGNHEGHHIVEPATGASATSCASVSVVAPTAMFADALGTAAFVLGPHAGIDFLEAQGADGFIVSSDLREYATEGFSKWLV